VACELGYGRAAKVFQIDTPLPGEVQQPPKLIATCNAVELYSPVFLVECDSEILVIGYSDVVRAKMLVYRLRDLVMGRDVPVTSIGDKAIFLQRRTLVASAKALPTVVGDTITCFHPMKYCLSQYDLSSGSWSPAMDQCSLLRAGTEQGPCSFVHHIFTCCCPRQWYVVGVSHLVSLAFFLSLNYNFSFNLSLCQRAS
jgi:hypothetical protein